MTPGTTIQVRFTGQDEPTTLALRPVGLMAVERKWGGKAFEEQPIEAMLYGCWVSIGKPLGDGAFEAWVDSIDEIVADAPAVPPVATPSEPSPPSP